MWSRLALDQLSDSTRIPITQNGQCGSRSKFGVAQQMLSRRQSTQLDNPGNIKAVAVTGMGMDGVPIDERGNWLYPFISWHDPRTEAQLHWWEKNIGAEKSFRVGGNTLWRFSTALRLMWMAEHEPEILARTDKWLLIEDFLNFMLCGRRATDYTMASCTLLFDQSKLDWSEEILNQAGIERRLLCDAYPSGTLLGRSAAKSQPKQLVCPLELQLFWAVTTIYAERCRWEPS